MESAQASDNLAQAAIANDFVTPENKEIKNTRTQNEEKFLKFKCHNLEKFLMNQPLPKYKKEANFLTLPNLMWFFPT